MLAAFFLDAFYYLRLSDKKCWTPFLENLIGWISTHILPLNWNLVLSEQGWTRNVSCLVNHCGQTKWLLLSRVYLQFPLGSFSNITYMISKTPWITVMLGLYRTSRPVRKSGKFTKSGLSENRTFSFLDTRLLTLLKIERKKIYFFQMFFFNSWIFKYILI